MNTFERCTKLYGMKLGDKSPVMFLIIPGRSRHRVREISDASRIYQHLRNNSGEGASTFPDGIITTNGETVAKVSYNGRVWNPGPYVPGAEPLQETTPISSAPRYTEAAKRHAKATGTKLPR